MQDLVPPTITMIPPTEHDATTSNRRRVAASAVVVLVGLGWSTAGCGEDGTTAHRIAWLLRPDGSSSAQRIDGLDVAFNTDSWFIDGRGVIMLVSPEPNPFGAWRVVRFPLAG